MHFAIPGGSIDDGRVLSCSSFVIMVLIHIDFFYNVLYSYYRLSLVFVGLPSESSRLIDSM